MELSPPVITSWEWTLKGTIVANGLLVAYIRYFQTWYFIIWLFSISTRTLNDLWELKFYFVLVMV